MRVAALMLLASCSITTIKPVDTNWDGRSNPHCEADEAWPLLDTVGAAAFAGLGTAVAIEGTGNQRAAGAAISGVVALVLAGSAYWGFGAVRQCNAASDANRKAARALASQRHEAFSSAP
jgi:hypothetical protein